MSAENPRPGPEKTDQIRNKPVLTQKESEAAWLVWKRLNAAVRDGDEVSCEPLRPAGPSGLAGPGAWSRALQFAESESPPSVSPSCLPLYQGSWPLAAGNLDPETREVRLSGY